jgi:hypothetical protein
MNDRTLEVAERVASLLSTSGAPCVVIGALALAAHHYPRATADLDLAIAVPPTELARLAARLRAEGWEVVVREPDGNDPLGGVIDVRAPGAMLVQVVNFDNTPAGGFPRLVREALPRALPLEGTSLRVVDPLMLVAFKLYAGGPKSALDILALLDANPLDLDELQRLCDSLRLGRSLARVLALRS